MRLIDWTNILLFHCFAFTIGTAFVNSWSSSFAFKVLKDIEAMDQTISKYSEVLRFSWCRAFLFFLNWCQYSWHSNQFVWPTISRWSDWLPRFFFYKKIVVSFFLLIAIDCRTWWPYACSIWQLTNQDEDKWKSYKLAPQILPQ